MCVGRRWLTAAVSSRVAPATPVFHGPRAWRLLLVMLVVGILAAIVTGLLAGWGYAPAAGWSAAAGTFCVLVWVGTRGRDAEQTAAMASRDDPSPTATDLLLLMANLASLLAVGFLLVQAHSAHGGRQAAQAALAVFSVAASWTLVHVLYTLRYAVLYYSGDVGGINFNQDELPRFTDFVYLAFTIGMTYQVSDTNLESTQLRGAAFRHAVQSFLFGSMILATMVNLVAGLSP